MLSPTIRAPAYNRLLVLQNGVKGELECSLRIGSSRSHGGSRVVTLRGKKQSFLDQNVSMKDQAMTASTCLPPPVEGPVLPAGRVLYLRVLTWAFTLFNSVRVLAYVPTTWAIYASGDASQHSLWTWCIWFGANLTMAAWLYEQNGRCISRAAAVCACNALMCGATALLILAYRL